MGRRVAQKQLGFCSIGLRMSDVARPRLAVYGSGSRSQTAMLNQLSGNTAKKIVKSCPAAHCNIVNLIACFFVLRRGGQKVRLNDVSDVTKISTGFTIPIDVHLLTVHQRRDPLGDYRRVGAIRVLAWPEYVEVSEANTTQPVAPGEHGSIEFVN